ncbi:MAG: PAS domain-containing protein, partial [Bacteroidota bacterium]
PYWIEIKGQPLFNNRGDLEHFFAIEEDITTRKEYQKKVEENNIRLELALKGIAAATFELNLETGEVYYSDYLYNITGYLEGEIKHMFKENSGLIHTEDSEKTFAAFKDFLHKQKDSIECEFRVKHKKGYYIWVLMRAVISEKNKDQKPTKIIGIFIDISRIKDAQQKIEESEARYRKSIEASGAALWEWDLIHDEVFATKEFRKIFGLPDAEQFLVSYKTLIPLVHPEDAEKLDSAFQDHLSGKTHKLNIDYRFKRPDTGQYEWYNMQGAIIERNAAQIPSKAMGYSMSIQERKTMELQLKESEERWYNAMVVSGAGFWEYNVIKDTLYFSTQMKNILGYINTNNIPENVEYWKNRIHPEDLEPLQKKVQLVSSGQSNTIQTEFRLLNKQDNYIWINASGMIRLSDEGKRFSFSGAAYDITEKKLADIAMEKARQMAESSVKAKRRFLANVSHEIRTPMHAIMGLSEQLLLSELKPEQKVLIQMIAEASRALMNIINDVLDLSKIEEGKLQIDETIFDTGNLMQQATDLFAIQAAKKKIEFELQKPDKIERAYLGDATRIRQIVSNIVSNAIKFTDKGKVSICYQIKPSTDSEVILSIVCTDTGVGMSEEMKKRIFEEFVQEDESYHRKYGGSGLGLSITHELIKLMNGSIQIESKKNQGTTVTVDIPLKVIRDPRNTMETPLNVDLSKLQAIKLLVAEDNEFNRLLLKFILEKNKIPYDFAENGKLAVEKAMNHHYDMILMDIQMPEMDGIEATQMIRERLGNHIPIIAVTANAIKEELEYYLTKGLSDYLTKPFEERKLLEKILQFINI